MCLKGETIGDIKDYLIGLGITTVEPLTLDDFTLKPINDFMEYELEILKYLSKSTINLYPKIIFNKVSLCVEQTIGDLINCILYNPTTKKLDLNYLPRDIQKNLNPEFKQFIETYSDGPNSFSQEKIDALVRLLSDRETIQYDKLINDQRIEMISILENLINVINLLFNTQVASFNEFGKLISSNNNSCSFEKISENQTKIVIKKQIQEEKSFYDQFIFGVLSIKKEHASFTLTEPEKNLTDEEVDQLLEKNKKFSSIVHTSRSFLSITGKALFYRSLKLANSSEKDEKIAADLIKEDIDVNSQETETLLTPLLVAIYYEAPANIIKLLIDYGADINIQAIDGKTPLHLALEKSQDPENEILEMVLNAKPNVNIKDNTGRTPLNFIITEGISECFFPVIKRLIALKAEINTTDNKGRSPLNSKKINEEIREYLTEELKKQTQLNVQSDDNE